MADTQVADVQEQGIVEARVPIAALACGVLGVLAAVGFYWLVLPGVVLGLAAVGLGWRARGRRGGELSSVAITLGVLAVLLVPATLSVARSAEDWGRDCALHPESDPNC
jgi:hypothetical protein